QKLTLTSSCSVGVAFQPQSAGAKKASLEIPDNTFQSFRIVPLSGTGVLPGSVTALYLDGDLGDPVTFGRQLYLDPDISYATNSQVSLYLSQGGPPTGSTDIVPPIGEALHLGVYDNTLPNSGLAKLASGSSVVSSTVPMDAAASSLRTSPSTTIDRSLDSPPVSNMYVPGLVASIRSLANCACDRPFR